MVLDLTVEDYDINIPLIVFVYICQGLLFLFVEVNGSNFLGESFYFALGKYLANSEKRKDDLTCLDFLLCVQLYFKGQSLGRLFIKI